jgi:uncharacterized protein (TIGR00369 family)
MLYESVWHNEPELYAPAARFVACLRQCTEIGITVELASTKGVELKLPYSQCIIGNIDNGVIHGGALTTLMDTASGASVMCGLPALELCPTLDMRVDYLRQARPEEIVYARATCFRVSKTIVFTRCEAFQREPVLMIASCLATFMRIGRSASPQWFWDMIEGKSKS